MATLHIGVTQTPLIDHARTAKAILTFLLLTVIISTLAYIPIITRGSLGGDGQLYGLALMWSPALAAILTTLIFFRSISSIGWKPGNIRYLGLAYVLPILYCVVAYGTAWLTGLAGFSGGMPLQQAIPLVISGTIGGIISGLGEEIGWRGFLVPQLAKLTSFTKTALISGIIWALWHYPYILFTDVIRDTLLVPYALVFFTILAVAFSFAFTWLRLKSGSVWPVAVLHGSHNLFMLHVFDAMTRDTGRTWYYLGEYGLLTSVVMIGVALIFWRLRSQLPDPNPQAQP